MGAAAQEGHVSHPQTLASGESTVGTTRTLVFRGGLTLVEHVVYWNLPLCYAYDTQGKVFPLENYIGLMGVEPNEGAGGVFILRGILPLADRSRKL